MDLDAILNKTRSNLPQMMTPVPRKKKKSGKRNSKENYSGLQDNVWNFNLDYISLPQAWNSGNYYAVILKRPKLFKDIITQEVTSYTGIDC